MTFPETFFVAPDLTRTVSGWVIKPGDTGWDGARSPFNFRMDQHPAVAVHTAGPADIAAAVRYAVRQGVQVAAQSTGHGAGASRCEAILLRTGRPPEGVLNAAGRRAAVGAGVRCRDLLAAASPLGLGFSVGSADRVGVDDVPHTSFPYHVTAAGPEAVRA